MRTRNTAICISAAVALAGCAAPGKGGGGGQATGQPGAASSAQVCNPVAIGAIAALTCGALARGNNRVRAAAACAAAAVTGCYLANSYKAEQVRTAKQVEDEYIRRNRQLPEKTTVTEYKSEVNPRGAVSKGQQVTLSSTIVAVQGRSDTSTLIEEELVIVDSQGEVWGPKTRKRANSGDQAGEFKTTFSFPVSNDWSQGVYTLRRTLYVNGAVAKADDASARFQIVRGPSDQSYALMSILN